MKGVQARYLTALLCGIALLGPTTLVSAGEPAQGPVKLVSARSTFQPIGRDYGVVIKLSGDGAKLFAEKLSALAASSGAAVSTTAHAWFTGNVVVTARGLRRDEQAVLMNLAHQAD